MKAALFVLKFSVFAGRLISEAMLINELVTQTLEFPSEQKVPHNVQLSTCLLAGVASMLTSSWLHLRAEICIFSFRSSCITYFIRIL